ncbi:hypothetical protein CPB85DRAFT_1437003 [Mucidula mucida]|nr:hypothetical protein CPB85DRAFT_1437003 [Mucidula mucida]
MLENAEKKTTQPRAPGVNFCGSELTPRSTQKMDIRITSARFLNIQYRAQRGMARAGAREDDSRAGSPMNSGALTIYDDKDEHQELRGFNGARSQVYADVGGIMSMFPRVGVAFVWAVLFTKEARLYSNAGTAVRICGEFLTSCIGLSKEPGYVSAPHTGKTRTGNFTSNESTVCVAL